MNRDISVYLKDILENMERAERFVEGKDYEDFVKDEIKENIPQMKPFIKKALREQEQHSEEG